MEFSGHTCSGNYNGRASCGGDGFAFVMQPSGPRVKGSSGQGLGYKGINSAFAIEFDTVYNSVVNDPTAPYQRHISVIAKAGTADGNEA